MIKNRRLNKWFSGSGLDCLTTTYLWKKSEVARVKQVETCDIQLSYLILAQIHLNLY